MLERRCWAELENGEVDEVAQWIYQPLRRAAAEGQDLAQAMEAAKARANSNEVWDLTKIISRRIGADPDC